MTTFSAREYGEMIMCYGEARGNSREALRIYVDRYPDRRHPSDSRIITGAYQRLLENQPIVPSQEGAGRPIRGQTQERILELVRRNPRLGTRTAARLLRRHNGARVSHWSVHKTLRRDQQRPYVIHKVQALLPRDRGHRVEFCRWLRTEQHRNSNFISHVIWTDESTFTRNGMWNRRNAHYWSQSNPFEIQESGHQTRWSVNVWAGIYGNKILGPVFLPARMDGPRYLHFLRTDLERELQILRDELEMEWEALGDPPLAHLPMIWFQHDGAPPHITLPVRSHLNATFPRRWLGRFGPQPWPARSPDLTPLDFFLWGYIKEKVFMSECASEEEMRDRITNTFQQLRYSCNEDPTLMTRLHAETLRRANLCERLGGGHFEPYLIRPERF